MLTTLTRWLGRPSTTRRSHKSRPVGHRPRLGFEHLEGRAVPSVVVTTDKPDYAPGETAILTATGVTPGETVLFQVLQNEGVAS